MSDNMNNENNIVNKLKIAIICIIAVALMHIIAIFNFNNGEHQNLKVYTFSCLGIGLYSLRQIYIFEKQEKKKA